MSSIFLAESVTIDGSGDGTIRFGQVPPFQRWTIDRISLTMTGGAGNIGGEARIFKNSADDPNFIDGTNTPWNDVYGGALELLPPDQLLVVFTLCSAGSIGSVTVQGSRDRL